MLLRVAYHEALEAAQTDLGTLGALMIDALKNAVKSVKKRDAVLAARIITGADQTTELSRRIEAACIELIWRQQPLANELRRVTGMFEISTDLGRVNHYVVDIAKHAVRLTDSGVAAPSEILSDVSAFTQLSLEQAVTAYVSEDIVLARDVLANDESQEHLYGRSIKALQKALRGNTDLLVAVTELLFVLTSLQRIEEHAASIAWHTEEMLAGDTAA